MLLTGISESGKHAACQFSMPDLPYWVTGTRPVFPRHDDSVRVDVHAMSLFLLISLAHAHFHVSAGLSLPTSRAV